MAKKGRTRIACITVVLIRSANDVVGLDIHSVNAASAASYAQTECKEASGTVHSGRTINVKKPPDEWDLLATTFRLVTEVTSENREETIL